jgi:hypothetical protein
MGYNFVRCILLQRIPCIWGYVILRCFDVLCDGISLWCCVVMTQNRRHSHTDSSKRMYTSREPLFRHVYIMKVSIFVRVNISGKLYALNIHINYSLGWANVIESSWIVSVRKHVNKEANKMTPSYVYFTARTDAWHSSLCVGQQHYSSSCTCKFSVIFWLKRTAVFRMSVINKLARPTRVFSLFRCACVC